MRAPLLLRWTWRDFRRRWLLVLAIALVLGLGTGAYAALVGSTDWRRTSNDASFALLRMHDLRVSLTEGLTAEAGTLVAAVHRIPQADEVVVAEERLVLPTIIDVSRPGRQVLVPGRIVGMPPDAQVDLLSISSGRGLAAGDPSVVLERSFAEYYRLPDSGSLRVTGDRALPYAGHGQHPQYFSIGGAGGGALSTEAGFGVAFAPLGTAQEIGGVPGRVNEVVLRLSAGADARAVGAAIEEELGRQEPALAGNAVPRADEAVYRTLYQDIEGDQQLWTIIAGLLMAGAAFATFNLSTRVVEAGRREIGVGMALGMPRWRLAVRPMLLGLQIAVLGMLLGIGVGVVTGRAFGGVFRDLLPLPVWQQSFPYPTYAQAAAVGFVLPLLAVAWPVWRAVRVEPVEAIRVGHLAARASRLAPLLRRVPLPGRSYAQLPLRNLVRTPRRTLLTALGIGAAISTLVAVFGMLDSFTTALDRYDRDISRTAPDRVIVQFAEVLPENADVVAAVTGAGEVARSATSLLVDATARTASGQVPLALSIRDVDGGLWQPSVRGGSATGLLLSEIAAEDLGVVPGDRVTLQHPRWTAAGVTSDETSVVVAGTHPDPIRAVSYLDRGSAEALGLVGLVNVAEVTPAAGVSVDELIRTLFAVPGVASAQPVTAMSDSFRNLVDEFAGILDIAAVITLLLALLIAFNATSIATDERAREHATMFAFGLPRRSVVGMGVVESAAVGLMGTVLGVGLGYLLARWTVEVQFRETMPDIGVTVALSPSTVGVALALGMGAVALTPLLTVRRLGRMDIPATLRVVE